MIVCAGKARLVNEASLRLADVRTQRSRNRAELTSTLDAWAREMLSRKASERAQARPVLRMASCLRSRELAHILLYPIPSAWLHYDDVDMKHYDHVQLYHSH